MEQNFQTSFIPKKPIVEDRDVSRRPVGLLTIISFFLFFAMVISLGGLYFYKTSLVKSISAMEKDLTIAKNRFEPEKITQLQTLDKRLSASSDILSQHISISPVFEVLGEITMKSVRYTKFSYELGEGSNDNVLIKLSGVATGYRSVALQSDLFSKNKNIIDPVFSNLSLDEKGNVVFELAFSVDPSFVDYTQTIKTEGGGTSVPPTNI